MFIFFSKPFIFQFYEQFKTILDIEVNDIGK